MFVFFLNRIDAFERRFTARWINDSQYEYNLLAKPVLVENRQHIAFFAAKNISSNEELSYNYGGGPYSWRYVSYNTV